MEKNNNNIRYRPLTFEQSKILEDSLRYNLDEDHNGAQGISLADRLDKAFNGNPPKIDNLTMKKMSYYNIITSKSPFFLYNKLPSREFNSIFGRLKKAGYKGPDGKGMKDYLKMTAAEKWNLYLQYMRNLDIFS